MRLRFAGLVAVASALSIVVFSFTACSGSGARPDPGSTDTSGTSTSSSSGSTSSGGTDDGGGEGGDADTDSGSDGATLPPTCSNTIKDGNETDTDCGGNACERCIDGKSCIQDNDCQGGSCESNKCKTATCNDLVTNGDESDKDCGGTICAKCTIGKRCVKGEDCVSGSCVGEVCKCAKGMAEVARSVGGAYCIDAVEVTKAEYNKFLTANVPVDDQLTECKPPVNTNFVPRGAWPPAVAPPYVQPSGLPFNLSLPVHYVDWCDANAYCKWAGKELCGKINGGPIAPGSVNDASEDAWYNACSQQGTKTYPYGSDFIDTKCNGDGVGTTGPVPTNQGYGFAENQDDGVYQLVIPTDALGNFSEYTNAQCQGGAVGLYQMSGNVSEWENSCDGTATTSLCRLRGGSYKAANAPADLACMAERTEARMPTDGSVLKDVGFRCCLY